eukprot:5688276-Amphidinium_carterae.2
MARIIAMLDVSAHVRALWVSQHDVALLVLKQCVCIEWRVFLQKSSSDAFGRVCLGWHRT